jgi:hypothetical protein
MSHPLCYSRPMKIMKDNKEKTNQPQPVEIVFEGWFRDEDEIWISDLDIRDRD